MKEHYPATDLIQESGSIKKLRWARYPKVAQGSLTPKGGGPPHRLKPPTT